MSDRSALLQRGLRLECATLAWNVAGVILLAFAALDARSVALAGFGLDSLIEIFASAVVIWQLKGIAEGRARRALRLIGVAFIALATYIALQASYTLLAGSHPKHSTLGIVWLTAT